ncbi:MAG TPA: hypothetical protein VJ978_01770 [Nitriliruptoraceae bacterium]|nr:hypothetical protein [Nitriliruptoraceae bacterium]
MTDIVVTSSSQVAAAMGEAVDAGRRWQVAGAVVEDPGAVTLTLAGRLAEVTVVGDGLVEVGGGVTLASLSQYVQSQLGYAPGWPLAGGVTVAGALVGSADAPPAVSGIVSAMSNAVVEVEVVRSSTRAAEIWDREHLWPTTFDVGLPDDGVVVAVTISVVAAASAVAAIRSRGPGRAPRPGDVEGG